MTSPLSRRSDQRYYSIFQGADMAIDFGHDAKAAVDYLADHADQLLGRDYALMVWAADGSPQVALIDAREVDHAE